MNQTTSTNRSRAILGPLFLLPKYADVASSDCPRATIQIRSFISRLDDSFSVSGRRWMKRFVRASRNRPLVRLSRVTRALESYLTFRPDKVSTDCEIGRLHLLRPGAQSLSEMRLPRFDMPPRIVRSPVEIKSRPFENASPSKTAPAAAGPRRTWVGHRNRGPPDLSPLRRKILNFCEFFWR
jgi:hypothetical protein